MNMIIFTPEMRYKKIRIFELKCLKIVLDRSNFYNIKKQQQLFQFFILAAALQSP